jgi:hypothetical protein
MLQMVVGRAMDSKILPAYPEIFSVFADKELRLLYRGSLDGFGANAFHARCNGHPNTVTLISTATDCVFGGYTPISWSSRAAYVSDPSLTSFLFTIKNPHNLSARIFKLKTEAEAIYDRASYGPTFGSGHDFYVCDECHNSNTSYSRFGLAYLNDTGISGRDVLNGITNFSVDEIEVFEVISRE